MVPLFIGVMTAFIVLQVVLAIPLVRRRVKPNALYGLRFSATFADDAVWYDANARSGWDLIWLAAIELAVLYALLLFPLPEGLFVLVNVAVVFIGTIAICIIGALRAQRMLKSRRNAKPE